MKHQSKAHRVGARKAIKPNDSSIELVSMQSFFPHPLLRWFQVQPGEQRPPPSPQAVDCMQRGFQQAVDASQQDWQAQFETIPALDLNQSQTAPWLTATGIASFLERLQLPKSELRALRLSPVCLGIR